MMSNGFRRERNSQNEGIQEHVPVGLQKLMRTFDPKEVAKVKVAQDGQSSHSEGFKGRSLKKQCSGKGVDYKGHIKLQPAFGDCLKAELKEVDIGLVTNGYIMPVIKTVVATVDGLNTDILLDTETYEALLEQERIYSPRFTAAMNLRSDSSKTSLDESVNTEEEEQEPTITEYDEENGNNTEKFKKQQHRFVILFRKQGILLGETKGGYVIENDILYHE
ncbi:retrovirus-related Pol polyprotein from transposon opus [Trichonephila clavipes]|uniref:Retrovirus-related Pol polyprotein from transposon opus n=1 Tax=Trichonephila clavipes TaxID=2585209 RepID=A0A8X6SP00_TRICX|nr:retrovirus-related Pol polyprotein from transposon opus [Trichonephila clavipes]